jgi:hypothetical protein
MYSKTTNMINSSRIVEGFFQKARFNKVLPFIKEMDFGGNEGDLKKFGSGNYSLVNYDHSPMENKTFNTVVVLAVIEHIDVNDVVCSFQNVSIKIKTWRQYFFNHANADNKAAA